jgi:hypothetical protein
MGYSFSSYLSDKDFLWSVTLTLDLMTLNLNNGHLLAMGNAPTTLPNKLNLRFFLLKLSYEQGEEAVSMYVRTDQPYHRMVPAKGHN